MIAFQIIIGIVVGTVSVDLVRELFAALRKEFIRQIERRRIQKIQHQERLNSPVPCADDVVGMRFKDHSTNVTYRIKRVIDDQELWTFENNIQEVISNKRRDKAVVIVDGGNPKDERLMVVNSLLLKDFFD